jgi:diketogulonate reductase-like aldo/keto reductase
VRQRENLDLAGVRLTASDLADLDALARPDGRLDGQDPDLFEEL